MKLGGTASRTDPTSKQKMWFLDYILNNGTIEEFHHGCCVGGDEFMHRATKNSVDLTVDQIVLHPPTLDKHAMQIDVWEMQNCVWFPAKDYLARDRDIVKEIDQLIALPNGPERVRGSGTWYTVRYAQSMGKPIIICHPDGRIEER